MTYNDVSYAYGYGCCCDKPPPPSSSSSSSSSLSSSSSSLSRSPLTCDACGCFDRNNPPAVFPITIGYSGVGAMPSQFCQNTLFKTFDVPLLSAAAGGVLYKLLILNPPFANHVIEVFFGGCTENKTTCAGEFCAQINVSGPCIAGLSRTLSRVLDCNGNWAPGDRTDPRYSITTGLCG